MDSLSREILKDVSLDEVVPKPRGQRSPVDHWPTPVLLERAAYLRKMARAGDGSASEILKEYPQHTAMLLFRARSGEVEMHENCAVLFHVLAGNATLALGAARRDLPAQLSNTVAESGMRHELRAGDVAHVPAGVAHQWLIAGEKSVTCLVIQVQEAIEKPGD
jgi:mannose-6-phosphate isomerase-like protein (cupin superfamily)